MIIIMLLKTVNKYPPYAFGFSISSSFPVNHKTDISHLGKDIAIVISVKGESRAMLSYSVCTGMRFHE